MERLLPILLFRDSGDEQKFKRDYSGELLTRLREYAAHVAPERTLEFSLPPSAFDPPPWEDTKEEIGRRTILFERAGQIPTSGCVNYYFLKYRP